MISLLVASVALFRPVTAAADVTTSNGKAYRVETCFTDPRHLRTRFIYPDRSATYVIDGEAATTQEDAKAPEPAGNNERSFAFGHNFHAIHYNFARLVSARSGMLEYGGSAKPLYSAEGSAEGYRFDLPDTTPIEFKFSDWREKRRVPYRLELTHAGVTYDYRYTKVEFEPC